MVKQPKPKKCVVCKQPFTKYRTTQIICSNFDCAVTFANNLKDRQERTRKAQVRRSDKERKEVAKSLTAWLDEAQVVFNKWIRYRDADQPCISCGTTKPVQYCAGHYRTRKAASQLRFNEDNVHKQCNSHCNRHLSGNVGAYREALLLKIGPERLAAIENDNTVKRWTIEEAKAIKQTYKQLLINF